MDFRDVKEEDWQFILELRNNFFQNFQKQDSPIKQKNHIKK